MGDAFERSLPKPNREDDLVSRGDDAVDVGPVDASIDCADVVEVIINRFARGIDRTPSRRYCRAATKWKKKRGSIDMNKTATEDPSFREMTSKLASRRNIMFSRRKDSRKPGVIGKRVLKRKFLRLDCT